MGTLVVIGYDDPRKAEAHRLKMQQLEEAHLLDVAEAVHAVNDGQGKITLHHEGDMTNDHAVYGGLFTSLANLILMNSAAGASYGALREVGITDHFMKELAATLTPGSSAFFVLTRSPTPNREQLLAELEGLGGKVLMTSLSHEDRDKLQAALSGGSPPGKVEPAGDPSQPNRPATP
jgi:uncharacterized membrane protein